MIRAKRRYRGGVKKKRGLKHHLMTILCLLLILISIGGIVYNVYPMFKAKAGFEEISNIATGGDNSEEAPIDWNALKAINPQVVGWIKVPGTHIDYPVVQGTDNSYYLTHNFRNDYSGYGTPFLDYIYDFNRTPPAQNAVVYAHASQLGDEVGFAGLENFEDPAFYQEHPYVYYTTIKDGSKPVKYEIVAAIKERFDFDYRRPDFADSTDFLNYYNNVLSRRLYETGKVIYKDDQLVTLSTCVFDIDSGRIALICRRVDNENNNQSAQNNSSQKKKKSSNSTNNSSSSGNSNRSSES